MAPALYFAAFLAVAIGITHSVHVGSGDPTSSGVLRIVGVTFLVSGLFPLFATRGRHLAWVVFFAIGGIALWWA